MYPCNALAVQFFLDLQPCWDYWIVTGERLRIDRAQMLATVRLLRLPRREWPTLFRQVQVMEQEMLAAG